MDSTTDSAGRAAGLAATLQGLAAHDPTACSVGGRGGQQCRADRKGPVRWPLTQTGQALLEGRISPAHARVLAAGTQDLPAQVTAEAEPVLVAAAGRLDPGRLRRAVDHLRLVADPEGAEAKAERRHQRPGLWLSPTWDGMVAMDGLLEAEAGAGQTLLAALEPLARPLAPPMTAVVAGVGPTPCPSWPARPERVGGCPRLVGSAPS